MAVAAPPAAALPASRTAAQQPVPPAQTSTAHGRLNLGDIRDRTKTRAMAEGPSVPMLHSTCAAACAVVIGGDGGSTSCLMARRGGSSTGEAVSADSTSSSSFAHSSLTAGRGGLVASWSICVTAFTPHPPRRCFSGSGCPTCCAPCYVCRAATRVSRVPNADRQRNDLQHRDMHGPCRPGERRRKEWAHLCCCQQSGLFFSSSRKDVRGRFKRGRHSCNSGTTWRRSSSQAGRCCCRGRDRTACISAQRHAVSTTRFDEFVPRAARRGKSNGSDQRE